MAFNIYTSNRMENLVEALAGVVARPLPSPFVPETIVVQSKGMQRWLAMELARKIGIWANCKYPFPNKMVWQLFRSILPDVPDTSFFAPEVMTWKIMGLLPGLLDREEFAPLRHYLNGDGDSTKLFQLSGKIADTFDQYTLFRPRMLLEWEEGRRGEWQEILWRELATCGTGQHRARLMFDFVRLLEERKQSEVDLPERITVFGISYLPQYHMDILAEVSRRTEINLFLLSPCREYWGDIVSARERARRSPGERDYLVEGNPLLASLGKLARDFSNMVINGDNAATGERDLYEDPGQELLLTAIQSDILNLRGNEGKTGRRAISRDDRSVQVHSCHSPMREMEVLYDNLLDLLEREQGLTPRDVVVMTPDIETYAPYISMVFEGCRDQAGKIPYSIADRSLASAGLIAGAVLKLLRIPGSRLTATSVFDILESLPVSRRFGLEAQELETIRSWLEETRICWGVDEHHRASLGLPAYRDNSWQAGLDRLLLGYAMPEEGDKLFHCILPFDEMEGESAQTLGKFAGFVDMIVRLTGDMNGRRTLGGWRERLRTMIFDFIAISDDWAFELATVTGVVDAMGELEEQAGFPREVELSLVRSWLSSRLDQEEKGVGFMTGGVTFCAMLPMRSIPFRVVALVGMSDKAFPRQGGAPGFDLIARNPKPGDRSLRDEDRYLFLECLLSARDCLYISYVGQSVRDNSPIPPSVLVSEFLDAIDSGFFAEGKETERRLVTTHRLQAFSRSYFNGNERLFSYSGENCTALLEAARNPRRQADFIATPLCDPPAEMRDVTLMQLIRFFSNPARFLVENRLRIRLGEVSTPLADREPFALEGLELYSLSQQLLEKQLKGERVDDLRAAVRCRGILPPSLHGEEAFACAVAESETLAASVGQQTGGESPLPPLYFQETIGEFRLSGTLDGIWPGRKIACRCARMKAKDHIRTWIEHLVLNASTPEEYPRESCLIMKDGVVAYRPVENAREILSSLLDHYWEGLKMPLKFFPASSMEFVAAGGNMEKARKKWESSFKYSGEEEDPYFRLCFGREDDPLSGRFGELALELLGPMVSHRLREET